MLSVCVFFPFCSTIKFISSFIWFSVDTNNLLQVAHNDNQDKSEFENCSWLLIPDLVVIRVWLIFIELWIWCYLLSFAWSLAITKPDAQVSTIAAAEQQILVSSLSSFLFKASYHDRWWCHVWVPLDCHNLLLDNISELMTSNGRGNSVY